MKYKYIFFDFNGTIIDDLDLCIKLLNDIQDLENIPRTSKEEYKEIFTFPIIDYYRAAGITFEKYSFEELSKFFVSRYQKASFNCSLYPHIKETIIHLNELGYKVVLLSASQIDNLLEQCNEFNITNLFVDILGIDNIKAASKFNIAKEYLLKYNINPKECLFIGDSIHDYEVGHTLGGDVVLVTYGHQSKKKLSTCKVPLIDDIKDIEVYL